MRIVLLLLLGLALPSSSWAFTCNRFADPQGCWCGEWTDAIWLQRHYTAAHTCKPGFTLKGRSDETWGSWARGAVGDFIRKMESYFDDNQSCTPKRRPDYEDIDRAYQNAQRFSGFSQTGLAEIGKACKGGGAAARGSGGSGSGGGGSGGGPEGPFTCNRFAAPQKCWCGEWTDAIWLQRHYTAAHTCRPGFTLKGRSDGEWGDWARGAVGDFIRKMESYFDDNQSCKPKREPDYEDIDKAYQNAQRFSGFSQTGLAEIGKECNGGGKDAPRLYAPIGGGPEAETSAHTGPPVGVAVQVAVDSVGDVRRAQPGCIDPKAPQLVLDEKSCNDAVVDRIMVRTGNAYPRQQIEQYWNWYQQSTYSAE